MHPSEFAVNEAWIVFQLNDVPLVTDDEGAFHCIVVMDAASCFILTSQFVPVSESEPSELDARRLLKNAMERAEACATRLFIPHGRFPGAITAEGERLGMLVEGRSEDDLTPFTGEAREGFREYLDGQARQD